MQAPLVQRAMNVLVDDFPYTDSSIVACGRKHGRFVRFPFTCACRCCCGWCCLGRTLCAVHVLIFIVIVVELDRLGGYPTERCNGIDFIDGMGAVEPTEQVDGGRTTAFRRHLP